MAAITPASLRNAAAALTAAADAVARLAAPGLTPADRVATLAELLRRLDAAVDTVASAHTWATHEQAAAAKPAAPQPETPPAPPAKPAVPTLAEYAAAMRSKFPATRGHSDAQFGNSYAGFLASKLGLPAWVGLTPAERRAWAEKAMPTPPPAVEKPAAKAERAPAQTAAKAAPAQPVARAKADAPESSKGAGLARYRDLVAEAKAAGLSAKGTKAELEARLAKHTAAPKAAPAPAPATPAPAPAKGLASGTHIELARKLGVPVESLVDALADLKLALVTVS
jgi:hypothetical protein